MSKSARHANRATRQRLRIAIVTSIHLDFDGRIWRHARSLVEAGCHVHLICPWAVPDGEVRDGVVLRTFRRASRRSLVPFLVPLRVCQRLAPLLRHVELVHFHDLDLLPWMAVVSRLRPVVYDVHENYPDEMLVKEWMPRLLRRPLYHIVRVAEGVLSRVMRNCVLVVPAQDARFSSPRLRVIHMRNYASQHLLASVHGDYLSRRDVVVFSGAHHIGNGSLLLLDIASRARAKGLRVKFLMTDRFASETFRDQFLREIDRLDLNDTVVIRSAVRAQQIMSLLNEGTIAISPNLRLPIQEKGIHTKLFEYMAAGLPIVASDLPNQIEIVGGSKAGLLARPEEPETFVEALAQLTADRQYAQQLGLNGRRAFLERYSWESQIPSLLRFYDEILGRAGAPVA